MIVQLVASLVAFLAFLLAHLSSVNNLQSRPSPHVVLGSLVMLLVLPVQLVLGILMKYAKFSQSNRKRLRVSHMLNAFFVAVISFLQVVGTLRNGHGTQLQLLVDFC